MKLSLNDMRKRENRAFHIGLMAGLVIGAGLIIVIEALFKTM